MIGFRWTLGIVTALVTAGLLAIAVIGGGFRRSFGASDSPMPIVITLAASGLVLASLVWPGQRVIVHLVALLMVGLAVGSIVVARKDFATAAFGVVYAAAWLSYYVRLLRA